jgi:putative Mg2+ transporter-C (MgtC) family protein
MGVNINAVINSWSWNNLHKQRQFPNGILHFGCLLPSALAPIVEISVLAQSQGGSVDSIRAIEAVTAGVAFFLAAGTILQARGHVRGLTTGASMWLAGSIGLACGFGHFTIAAMATTLALFVLAELQTLSLSINPEPDTSEKEKSN